MINYGVSTLYKFNLASVINSLHFERAGNVRNIPPVRLDLNVFKHPTETKTVLPLSFSHPLFLLPFVFLFCWRAEPENCSCSFPLSCLGWYSLWNVLLAIKRKALHTQALPTYRVGLILSTTLYVTKIVVWITVSRRRELKVGEVL